MQVKIERNCLKLIPKTMPSETCVNCRKLFSNNRFDRLQSFHKCPCFLYGMRKTYIAVKKAVEKIEKEER